ncbi:MAG: hypothetical protein KME60_20440 [Cyanomargarita calcarea GSE-NOS-MK-12-04C]|jgi:hypothetical protein|uniref:HigA protein (Antitoxin to HigB) n=1 Tax=Cyanomargarita calcarea GSE-NOS-MK-12-04C TaxID=2839659 RepID=A0A951QS06_9CYAN|nr:hypothetical protein [Cyanomargarita calcarea GSE-NOS-MK-12-04C]
MSIASFQQIIDSIENLSLEEQNYLFELIQKRRIEKRRSEIAAHAQTTLKAVEMGTAKRGNINDLRADLLGDEEE